MIWSGRSSKFPASTLLLRGTAAILQAMEDSK